MRRPDSPTTNKKTDMSAFLASKVRVVGLKSRPELNGQEGMCMAFDGERYEVRIAPDRTLRVKAENMMLLTAEPAASSSPASSAACGRPPTAPSYHDAAQSVFGCKHYQRSAHIVAFCCDRVYPCRCDQEKRKKKRES